jgi:predicted dehydrogenase
MGKLRSVLIGCGAIAREHLAALNQLGTVDVAAVCDLSKARAEAMAERFAVPEWSSSYRSILERVGPDVVHITTPPSSHFEIAKFCVAAGLNVFCEKPITVRYEEFEELKTLAIKNHCTLMENHNFRFHSSVQRILKLIECGELGNPIEAQVHLSLDLLAAGNPSLDQNAPHFSSSLKGGVIGDFLPHLAYLACLFTGPISDVRTIWRKYSRNSPLSADEFRGIIKGERATAYVAFSGNAQPNGFWLRVMGTRALAEANLFEPPRLTLRRLRSGEPALMSLIDGIAESRDVLRGTIAGFSRKLGGTSSYDGLPELIELTYRAIEAEQPQPVSLHEIGEAASLVDRFTRVDLQL